VKRTDFSINKKQQGKIDASAQHHKIMNPRPRLPILMGDYRGVTALVLGGSGFIGTWTVRALHACGANVVVATRNSAHTRVAFERIYRDLRIEVADLTLPNAVRRLISATRPTIVFNLAGYGVDRTESDRTLMTALNAKLPSEVCQALAGPPEADWTGVRLVHVGSAAEYGPVGGTITETSPEHPITDYGCTKLEGTRALLQVSARDCVPVVVARLFTVYGAGEHPDKLLSNLLRAARTGARLPLTSGRQLRNFTYVEDVAEGLLRLGLSGPARREIVNVGGTRAVSVREFAETAAAVLGFDPALLDFNVLADRHDEMWHGHVDGARLRTLTSWMPPTSVADGIRRTWELTHV
jgi:dTDP-6-deoxy-L-talose 4-dehydrogenase [NAD(P)+]